MRSSRNSLLVSVLVVVAILARCPGRAQDQTSGLFDQRIVAIEFDCDAPIDVPGLRNLMPMKVGDRLRADDLKEAQWRLEQKQLFTSIAMDPQPRGNAVAVVIHLVRKPIVNRIRFEGNHEIGDTELHRLVRLRESTALTDELRDYSLDRIRKRYVAEGFDQARVTADVSPRAPGEVDVIFQIYEGVPLRMGAIVIEGKLPIPEEQVRKAFKIGVGDRYVHEQQRAAEKAIVRLLREKHYYEAEVVSQWEPGPERTGTLRFSVEPGPVFKLEFSGNHQLSDRKLLDLIDLPKRPIVTDGTWRELARRAHHAYQEKGYYFAKAEVNIEPGAPKRVHFSVDEGRSFHVAAAEFEGNTGLGAGQLRAAMATGPPSWIPWRRGVLLDDVLDDDLKRLWYLYRRHGFEAAEIIDNRARFDEAQGKIFLAIVIEEGRQTIVRDIELTGAQAIAERLPSFAVKVGEPLDREKVETDRRALLTALATAGYTHATVQPYVSSKPAGSTEAATVRFEVDPGVQQRVGTIVIQNNFDTRASVILRELPFEEGEPLDPQALLQGQTNIYKLGIFRSVTVRPLATQSGSEIKPNREDVTVALTEKPPGSVQWGAGYNTRDGFRGFVEVSDDNLQGLARRLSLRGDFNLQPGDVTPNEYLGNLGFREPRLDATKWTFRSNLIAQRSTRSVDQFSLERVALIPALERTIFPGLQTGVEAQIEQAQVFNLAPDVANFNPRDQGRLRSISVGPFVVYDGRDDPFVPRRGVFDSVRLRVAPGQFGSDVPFLKFFAQHVHYVALNDDLTFVYVLRAGWTHAYENRDLVPIRERFFLGGRTTVRGFAENQIGPQGNAFIDSHGNLVSGGDPLGGDLLLNLNTELRFPLVYGFGGAVFVDGGGLYLEDRTGTPGSCSSCGSVSLHDFRRSTGLGLRYITPVGPISLDYGFKLDRRPGESIGQVHFSVGIMF